MATVLLAVLTTAAAAAPPPVPDPPPGCTPPTEGRVALWRAEGSPEDSAGVNHATTAGPTASYRFGVIGEAFSLPGAGDHVTVPDAGALDLGGDLTIEAWVRLDDVTFGVPDEHGVGGDRVIAWKAGEQPLYGLWIEGDGVTAEAAPLGFISGDRAQESGVLRTEGLAWAKDTWYHVAVTRSGTAVRFYRDGEPVGDALTGQTGIPASESQLTLGAVMEEGDVYNPLKGALDETGLWNRALDGGEVAAIYETGTRACEAAPPSPTPAPTAQEPDTTPPDTTITGPPNGTEITDGAAMPVYEIAATEAGASLECRAYLHLSSSVFSADHMWRPCTSPYTVTTDTRTPGNYAVEARAVDAAGNADPTPAQRWVVRHRNSQGVPAADRKPDRCAPVRVLAVRGRGPRLVPGCRLGAIRKGRVACIHIDTGKLARCSFKRRSGRWVRSTRGRRFAMVGQAISKAGKRNGGRYVVAARRGQFQKVPCAPARKAIARAADVDGRVADGMQLGQLCMVETLGADYNSLSYYGWKPLLNWTSQQVCSRNHPEEQPHPDYPEFTGFDADGFACYTGLGAALNDRNGTERDQHGVYYQGEEFCHMVVSNGYEVPGAKRPATLSNPPELNRRSYIVWRPVNPYVVIANGPEPSGEEEDPEPVYGNGRAGAR